jgi:XTP/dITP diphosphohydrolase
VEDAGLFIEALNGFPGPFSSYVYKTIGTQGVLRLMRGIKNRNALFLSAVAFCKPKSDPQVFVGKVDGVITLKERGGYGFGFDPIFQPKGKKKTFAEMRRGEKNKFSHRAKALRNFAEWFNKKI